MRVARRRIQVGIGALVLLGCLAAPGTGQAGTSETKWKTRGCVPAEDNEVRPIKITVFGGRGLDANAVVSLVGTLNYTAPLHPITGTPLYYTDSAQGTLALTLRVLNDQRDSSPWTNMRRLGFDLSAMDDPDPKPIKVKAEVNGTRRIDTRTINRGKGTVTGEANLPPHTLPTDAWNRAFASYAVVAAKLELTTSSGKPWCTVKINASPADPIAEFSVLPSNAEIDAAAGKVTDAAEEAAEDDVAALAVVVGSLALILGLCVFVGVSSIRRRRKPATLSPPSNQPGTGG